MMRYIVPICFLGGGIILGIIFQTIIIKALKRFARRTKWEGDEVIVESIQKWIFLWFFIIGAHFALNNISLKQNYVNILNKLFTVIYIFSVTIVVANILSGFIRVYARKTKDVLPATSIFANITKLFILLIGLLIILNSLGVSITPLITTLGIGGLAIALALQDTLTNLFTGFQIILSKQIKAGDYIKLQSGEEGFVVDITWRNTCIREFSNNIIIIPNSKLASSIITNYNLPSSDLSVVIPVCVSYDSDLEKVEKIVIDVGKEAMKITGMIENFEPLVRFNSLGENGVNFNVILKTKDFSLQYILRHEFIKRLYKKFKEKGIVVPYPSRNIYIKKDIKE